MQPKILEILEKAKKAIFCYPLVLLMSLVMTISVIYLINDNYGVDDRFTFVVVKITIIASIGISLLFALKMIAQRAKNKLLWSSLGVLFLVGFYFVLPSKEDDFTEMYAFLLIPIYILSHLLVAFGPFIKKEHAENTFWQYNKTLFVNSFLTLVFTGVLIAGVELAIAAISNLFNLHFSSNVYMKTFFFILIFGSTFIFLLFSEEGLENLEKETNYPVILKFFTQFILIPLLLFYAVILYFYMAKILLNWELPKGWVSYLVLAYSMVGILALLLVHPLKENHAKSWVSIFSKVFYYTLIPLLLLLFVAIFTRLLEYGYTEARYFVLLLAIWLSSVVLYFVLNKKASIKFIPMSLFLFATFALVFPYFNAFSVATRSQKSDLERILQENNLLVNGKIDFDKEVDDFIVYEIENKFNYLDNRLQRDYLNSFLNETAKKEVSTNKYWYLYSQFKNVKTETENTSAQSYYIQLKSSELYFDIADYQYVINKQNIVDSEVKIGEDRFKVAYDGYQLFNVTLNNRDTVDLIPLVANLFKHHEGKTQEETIPNVFVECDLGDYHIKIIFNVIEQKTNSDKSQGYWVDTALFLIKKK